MKLLLNNSIKITAVFFTVLFTLISAPGASAKSGGFYSATTEKQSFMINNLKAGIMSDNQGLRRSSIYYAGCYQVAELTSSLIEQLDKEPLVRNRKLILLSLYKTGGDKALKAIEDYVTSGKDTESRILAQCIINEYSAGTTASLLTGIE